MDLKSASPMLNILQTRIGIVFSIFVPAVFLLIWMTGYNHATDRIDQLRVGLVGVDAAGAEDRIASVIDSMPFQVIPQAELSAALDDMNEGGMDMVIALPSGLAEQAQSGSGARLTYYVNDRSSEVVKSVMEGMAARLTTGLNGVIVPDAKPMPIQGEVVKTNPISNFATSMLPMILGFIPYIASMTANIQFNISSMRLIREYSQWDIFLSRQFILAGIAIVVPLLMSAATKLFLAAEASFWQLWGFEALVFAASLTVTQFAFAYFGNAAPLFNVLLIPVQLMTAGNIISASMLSPFYRELGSFLPVPNGVDGAMRLVYGGGSLSGSAMGLVWITVVALGLSIIRIAWSERGKATVPVKAAA
ncbi:YhgE/Pip domain-containing protein [Paenibacillus methanolicus]|uniref:ABC-2 family transporter protein n=1 Tax=Paenibacillus methanolicus TaxID=582686 RepID=A0A5S5C6W2_9BACL|nr:ABC transporter permease [Paenibacillus methanolicus]TYP74909.1 ABC-2 family transporter protein [Paenibacillus methanolicus]